jgi:large subunit ribosomal protein L6
MSTSRVGRKPVTIPSGVNVEVTGENVLVKGPKGQLTIPLHPSISLDVEDGQVTIRPNSEVGYCRSGSGLKLNKSIAGTTRAKIFNMVTGVTKGFERKLLLVGVGYKAQAKGKVLGLTIGFSHPVDFNVPEGITVETPTLTEIVVKGIDKHLVGHTAAMIRDIRGPEPYKGKGIRYANENIIRKETKKK